MTRLSPLDTPRTLSHALWTWGEMIKFSHSLFALPFAVLATFLAAASARPAALPSASQLFLIIVCMIGARSAAMTFNRIVDAAIDRANPRTAMRAIPRGTISPAVAWALFTVSAGVFLVGCAGFAWLHDNRWPLALSLPVLAYLCFYSYTKRFTRYAHLVLGSAIAIAPLAAWIAIHPATLGVPALLLSLAVTTWIAGFDIIYACQDAEFDRSAGLHSLPARVGVRAALWIARALHAGTSIALLALGLSAGMGIWYFSGAAIAIVLLIIENALVSERDLSKVNLAFFTVNGVVGVILGALGIVDTLVRTIRP